MMKAVFIVFNQTNTERVEYILDKLEIRGYSFWQDVHGRGSVEGPPHKGSHVWPELNSAIITIVNDDRVQGLLDAVHKLDIRNKSMGVHAFVWNTEQMV